MTAASNSDARKRAAERNTAPVNDTGLRTALIALADAWVHGPTEYFLCSQEIRALLVEHPEPDSDALAEARIEGLREAAQYAHADKAKAWDEGSAAGALDAGRIVGWCIQGAPDDDRPELSSNPYRHAPSTSEDAR